MAQQDSFPALDRTVRHNQLAAQADALSGRFEHEEALALITREIEGRAGPEPAVLTLARVRALLGLERFRTAADLVYPLTQDRVLEGRAAAEARQLYARALLRMWSDLDWVIDFARDAAQRAVKLGAGGGEVVTYARGDAAIAFARKRSRECARRELTLAREVAGETPLLLAFEASVHLDFDERAEAKALYERCASMGEGAARRGLLGLASVARLMGEFDAAHRHLDAVTPLGSTDLAVRGERARLFVSERRWLEAADAWAEFVRASPLGDGARHGKGERARALFHAGRRDDAVELWRRIVDESIDDHVASHARRTLQKLEIAQRTGKKRATLQPFPSITQLRDHCGPACCELYLEFLGIPADQVEIARQIKLPNAGTYTFAMKEFLEKAGLHARRVEATLDTMRTCIDLRVPLILEEEYSTSRHVAVAIGYDDEREVLEIQDPMTHELRETPYEALSRLLETSNHGAVIAVPNTPEKICMLDEAGVREAEYIVIHDQAVRAEHDKRFDEALSLVNRCLELRDDYELAWMTKFHLLRRKSEEKSWGAPKAQKEWDATLEEILRRFPDDEWPQQLLGYKRYNANDFHTALSAFERARDRDDGDAYNWAMIADCLIALGRREEAVQPLYAALRRMPGHVRASENLADLLESRGEIGRARALNDVGKEAHPDNPFNFEVEGRIHLRRRDFEAAYGCFERAVQKDPARGYAFVQMAKALAELGKVDEAAEKLEARIKSHPDEKGLRTDLADLLYRFGRYEQAIAWCEKISESEPTSATPFAIHGASLAALGKLEEGSAKLREAIARWPAYAWAYTELGRYLEKAGRALEATQHFAAAHGLHANAKSRFHLGASLVAAGAERDGVWHLRESCVGGHLDEDSMLRAAELIAKVDGFGAGWAPLRTEADAQKDAVHLQRAHIRFLLDKNWYPWTAKPYLERLEELAPNDLFARLRRGERGFDRFDTEKEGEAVLRDAIAQAGGTRAPRLMLAQKLSWIGRYEEALDLLSPLGATLPEQRVRVRSLAQLGRTEEAMALAAGHVAAGGTEVEARELEHVVAESEGNWARALELSEKLAQDGAEREDDGELGQWEEKKFEALLRLGEKERAEKFGERQIGSAEDAAHLAHGALYDGRDPAMAERFVVRALALDPEEVLALRVRARLEELAGEDAKALETLASMRAIDAEDHPAWEFAARVLIGAQELSEAQLLEAESLAERGLQLGPYCPVSSAVRGQVRVLRGDLAGAREDLERAWLRSLRRLKMSDDDELWAILAALRGERESAAQIYKNFMRSDVPRSPNDERRTARVLAKLGVAIGL